jgi:diguanylate cyclase (GGDEF)-like protein/PAS domain S-box-containing protein
MTANARILVVDDNATNRKLVASLLTYEGYRVTEAADAAEGLAIARSGALRLVISDILMPSMDGYEFVRRLRADTATANLAVIFYTANYHEHEAISLARQCGVARVLVKPCATSGFLQAIAEVLAGTGAAPSATAPDAGFNSEHLRLLTDKLSQKADALRAANSRLSVLTELNLQIASERDLKRLLNNVCANARELLGARFAVLAVADKVSAGKTEVCVSGLTALPTQAVKDPRDDKGVLGRIYAENRARRLVADDGSVDLGLPPDFPEVQAAIAVPVCSLTRTYGWLCVGEKVGARAFNAEDEQLLTIIGAQVGRVYENGSLYREVQEQATQLLVEVDERERLVAQLRASEELFRQLAENIQDVFFVSSPDLAQIFYVSPAFERVWGTRPDSGMQNPDDRLAGVDPADQDRVAKELRQIVQSFPAAGQLEFRILRPDASIRWVLSRFFPILDGSGKVVRTVGVTTDITERKLGELRIVRLNRTYSVLSGINSLIVRAVNRDALLRDVCRVAVEHGGFRVAWCGLLDVLTGLLRPTAFAGDVEDPASSIRFKLYEHTAKVSLVVEALRTQLPRLCNDLTRGDAEFSNMKEFAARGYRSMVALPLVVSGQVMGCFVLLTDVSDYFDDEEMRLLIDLAQDISFALDHIGKAERLRYLASFDALTGLPNRSAFVERISQYLGMATHTQTRFMVAIADPERFEALNNTLGREGGDELLRLAATRFAAAAGGSDVVAHVGSDKFAAIIPESSEGFDASRLLEEFWRRWLAAPFSVGGQTVELTAKAGVAIYPVDGESANALLANAEAALRTAKESGKTFGFYTANLSERFVERVALEKSLRRALENEEFVVYYQPKVNFAQRRVTGVEALIRWRRPDHGLILPAVFIPLLEENGMIVEVGDWVLRQAIFDRTRWLEQLPSAPRVAVNVSAVQLRRDDFVDSVSRIVKVAGSAAGLDIEVTETQLLADVAENLIKLAQIRDLGVGIALDDFGTGYSSLGYLAKLPVETLKIDRSFVASMLDDSSAMTLVSTIISLARSLKLETVAEGVESEEQAKILRLIGCDQMQGYLISRPLPFEELTVFLSSRSPT